MLRHLDRWPMILAASLYLAISFHFWWFLPGGDEAVHLYNAMRIRSGQLPFRDYFAYMPPGTYLFGAGVLAMVGDSIPLLRAVTGGLGLVAVLLVDRLLRDSGIRTVQRGLVLFAYVAVTALTATYFSHHNVDNFLFVALLALARDEPGRARSAALGALVALDAFVHQAHGAYFFLACGGWLLTRTNETWRERWLRLASFVTPSFLLFGALGLWLIETGSLRHFIEDVVVWPGETYRRELAFGPFEDNVFAFRQRTHLAEQVPLVAAKLLVLAGLAWLVFRLLARPGGEPPAQRLRGWLIVAFTAGHLQTLHNGAAYFALACLALWPLLALRSRTWTVLLVTCCSLQMVRAATHPFRYLGDYVHLSTKLETIGVHRFYGEPRLRSLNSLFEQLRGRGIDSAVVVGRAPEIYLLGPLRNPTRYDVLIPIYLDDRRLAHVLPQVASSAVIDDRSPERVAATTDFFDDHHYRRDGRLARFEQSPLFTSIAGRAPVYANEDFRLLPPP